MIWVSIIELYNKILREIYKILIVRYQEKLAQQHKQHYTYHN